MKTERVLQMGMLAKDLALARLRSHSPATDRVRSRIVKRMSHMHGLPQKIGQILSLAELSESQPTYAPLTESPATLPAPEAFALIEERLGNRHVLVWLNPDRHRNSRSTCE